MIQERVGIACLSEAPWVEVRVACAAFGEGQLDLLAQANLKDFWHGFTVWELVCARAYFS